MGLKYNVSWTKYICKLSALKGKKLPIMLPSNFLVAEKSSVQIKWGKEGYYCSQYLWKKSDRHLPFCFCGPLTAVSLKRSDTKTLTFYLFIFCIWRASLCVYRQVQEKSDKCRAYGFSIYIVSFRSFTPTIMKSEQSCNYLCLCACVHMFTCLSVSQMSQKPLGGFYWYFQKAINRCVSTNV